MDQLWNRLKARLRYAWDWYWAPEEDDLPPHEGWDDMSQQAIHDTLGLEKPDKNKEAGHRLHVKGDPDSYFDSPMLDDVIDAEIVDEGRHTGACAPNRVTGAQLLDELAIAAGVMVDPAAIKPPLRTTGTLPATERARLTQTDPETAALLQSWDEDIVAFCKQADDMFSWLERRHADAQAKVDALTPTRDMVAAAVASSGKEVAVAEKATPKVPMPKPASTSTAKRTPSPRPRKKSK